MAVAVPGVVLQVKILHRDTHTLHLTSRALTSISYQSLKVGRSMLGRYVKLLSFKEKTFNENWELVSFLSVDQAFGCIQ